MSLEWLSHNLIRSFRPPPSATMDLYRQLNDFQVYNGNYSRLQTNYQYKWSFEWERVEAHESVTRFLQDYWHHSVSISVLYYLSIICIERWMKGRPAFSLSTPLLLWNSALAAFSIFGFVRLTEDVAYSALNYGFYKTICYSCLPNDVAAFWSLLFAISKVVELGDTLFIVLRKKKLIFLHYYHHVAVLVYTIHSGAEHTAAGRVFMSMNYLAHSLMYSYFAACAAGWRPPRLLSACLTAVQTLQMVAGVLISCAVYHIKTTHQWPCQQSLANVYLSFIIYLTFAVLFIQFFYSAYVSKSMKSKKA